MVLHIQRSTVNLNGSDIIRNHCDISRYCKPPIIFAAGEKVDLACSFTMGVFLLAIVGQQAAFVYYVLCILMTF